jgi:MFS transporter, DHA1 family, multidrug resistance protein
VSSDTEPGSPCDSVLSPGQVPSTEQQPRRNLALFLTLGLLSAIGPLSLDLYLPALPRLARDFGAPSAAAQLTISACLVGLSLGQLLFGPISDRFGRRVPLLLGIGCYLALTLAIAAAPNLESAIVFRFLQGFAGSAGIVLSLTIARDRLPDSQLPSAVALVMFVGGFAPIIAPLLGGTLLLILPWRGLFVVLAVFAASMFTISFRVLPESLPPERRHQGGVAQLTRVAATVLRDKLFLTGALIGAFTCAALFIYISMSSFVLQDEYGISATSFSLVFAGNGVALLVGNRSSALALRRWEIQRVLVGATVCMALAVSGLFLVTRLDLGLIGLLPCLFAAIACIGSVMPSATSVALLGQGNNAGTASALLGTTQFLSGAIAGPIVTLAGASAGAMASGMSVALLCAVAVLVVMLRSGATRPAGPTAVR